jgi:hypothetical protein
MDFNLDKGIEILSRTPAVLRSLLTGLSTDWTHNNEGPDTWSPYDIVGHLIHGERTDWMQRMEKILAETGDKTFEPFDRFAQFRESEGKTLNQLLDEFEAIRRQNIAMLIEKKLQPADFQKKGMHPSLGEVMLSHLLSTWVAHDLGHISQITRVMAKQYKSEIGPWIAFMPVMWDRSASEPPK